MSGHVLNEQLDSSRMQDYTSCVMPGQKASQLIKMYMNPVQPRQHGLLLKTKTLWKPVLEPAKPLP